MSFLNSLLKFLNGENDEYKESGVNGTISRIKITWIKLETSA